MQPQFSQGTNAQGQGQGSIVPQNAPSPMAVTNLQSNPSPIQLPPPPTPSNTSAINASVPNPIPTTQDIINQGTAPTATQGQQSSILQRIAELTGGNQSLATLQTQNESSAGIPALAKTTNDLAVQLQGLSDQSAKLQLDAGAGGTIQNQAQNSAQGRAVTAGGLAPHTTADLRNNQIQQATIAGQALTLKSAYYAAQGQLSLAKDAADKAAQVTFDAQNQQIAYQKAQLDAIAPQLDKEQKAQAAQMQAQLAERAQQISFARQDFQTGQPLIIAAMKNNPNDPGAQFAAQQALKLDPSTPGYLGKVMNLVGKYQQDPIATQKAILDMQLTRAQIAKTNATSTGIGTGGVSDALKAAISAGLIDPNRVNSRTLGIYNSLAASQVDAAGVHASIAGNTKAFEDATRYATTATRVVNVLEKNMPLLASLADKVNQTGVPGIDQYVAGVKSYTGNNQDVVKYISTLKTLRSEYAQMLSRGQAVTESDKTEAAQAIPAGLSGENYMSLKSQLQLEGDNIISTANEVKNGLFTSTKQNDSSDTHVYNGVTYKLIKGTWTPQ